MSDIYLKLRMKYFNDPENYEFETAAVEDTEDNRKLINTAMNRYKKEVVANDFNRPVNFEVFENTIVSLKDVKTTEIFLKVKKSDQIEKSS